jgi:hypothetical protein
VVFHDVVIAAFHLCLTIQFHLYHTAQEKEKDSFHTQQKSSFCLTLLNTNHMSLTSNQENSYAIVVMRECVCYNKDLFVIGVVLFVISVYVLLNANIATATLAYF